MVIEFDSRPGIWRWIVLVGGIDFSIWLVIYIIDRKRMKDVVYTERIWIQIVKHRNNYYKAI